jgi:regulator of sigma E protease
MFIVIFLIILAALVFVHELGHFLVAKWAGIRVDEFAIGFPPRIFSITRGGTKYSLNLIPFGGYVKIFGEDYDEANAEEVQESPDKSRSFVGKPKYIQVMVLLAGIAFNILFAWVLLSGSFMVGLPAPEGYEDNGQNTITTITSIQPGSPAEAAGLTSGDKILALSADNVGITNPTRQQIQDFIAARDKKPIAVTYERKNEATGENETKSAFITPTVREGSDKPTVGITMEAIGTIKLGFFQSIWQGAKLTVTFVWLTAVGIAQFLGGAFIGKANIAEVTGPVGIAGLVNDATNMGLAYLLTFTAFISINLAIINLIPFPALDGGRVLFVIIEKIKGKAMNPKVVQIINTVGFALLLLLMIVVTFQDITKLFK